MATLGATATRISERLMDDSNTAVPLPRVKDAINDAIKYWKKRGKNLWFTEFEESVTLTVGNPAFSLTTNTALAIFKKGGMVITDNQNRYELTKVSSQVYDAQNIEAPGRPYIWTFRNNAFKCYFYPDQAYTLTVRGRKDYTAFATDTSEDETTNDWLTEAETLIDHEALARLHTEYRMDIAMGDAYSNKAEREFKALKSLHREKTGTGRNETCSILI